MEWERFLCRKCGEAFEAQSIDGATVVCPYCFEQQIPGPYCTCSTECEKPCKGACGCVGCRRDYQDFLSME